MLILSCESSAFVGMMRLRSSVTCNSIIKDALCFLPVDKGYQNKIAV